MNEKNILLLENVPLIEKVKVKFSQIFGMNV